MAPKAEAPSKRSKDRPLMARIDIRKAQEAGDCELGEKVQILIEGKVQGLRGPDEQLDWSSPGSIDVEVTSMKISATGEFDGMMGDSE